VRAEATRYRKWLENDVDPRETLADEAAQAEVERARRVTFRQVAASFLHFRAAGWRNEKHRRQWPGVPAGVEERPRESGARAPDGAFRRGDREALRGEGPP